jgi:predicted acetyltransferase
VATWADVQGKGYAGALMRRSLEVMKEQGQSVSALYPFSHRYYRKFGWETSGVRLALRGVTQNDLIRYDERALVRVCKGDAELDRLDIAYQAFARSMNGMVVRDARNWKRRLDALQRNRGQAYLIEKEKRPIGYFFCENHPVASGKYESRTPEFACATPEAWRAMIGFLSTFPPNVATFTLVAPEFPSILPYFKEPFFPIHHEPYFQFRVVDVPAALGARGFDPDVRGRIAIAIQDDTAPWNAGTWAMEFEGGTCRVETGTQPPDLALSIQEFSRLFLGASDPVALARQNLFPSSSPPLLHLLREAFRDRPPYLLDAF